MVLKDKLLQLDYVLKVKDFQNIQDNLSYATNLALITIDYKGNPKTEHSGCSAFCTEVRKDLVLHERCLKCDSRGGLESARIMEPYIYLCHMGIIDFAVPILVNGQYLGALMAGQVRLLNTDKRMDLERIVNKEYQKDIMTDPVLKAHYMKLPEMSLEKIQSAAELMKSLVNLIVRGSVLENTLYEINRERNRRNRERDDIDFRKISEEVLLDTPGDGAYTLLSHKSVLIKPAIDFLQENFNQKKNMERVAELCNISSSYFSRIFKMETGYSYSDYINNLRVEKAKSLLNKTNQPIINISIDLGYEDCGYFIKIFKKKTGVTPTIYRKNNRYS